MPSISLSMGLMGGTQVFPAVSFDTNTLISPITDPAWNYSQYTAANGATITPYNDPTDGICGFVNQGSNPTGAGINWYRFVTPAGCTSVRLTVTYKKPVGDGATQVAVGVHDGATGYVGGLYISPVLTTSLQTFTQDYTVSANTAYGVDIICNFGPYSTTNARAIIKSISVQPLNGTGIFGGNFVRVHGIAANFERNAYPSRFLASSSLKDSYLRVSPDAALGVTTSATDFAVEWADDGGTYLAQEAQAYDVNEAYTGQFTPSATTNSTISTFTLSAGTKKVSVPAGAQYAAGGIVGEFPKALYVGATTVSGAPVAAGKQVMVYGDSTTVGFYGDVSNGMGAWQRLRRAGRVSPTLVAYGSRSLYDDCSDATARAAFVASLAGVVTGDIVLCIGTNDYGLIGISAATFGVMYADLLDRLHAAFPNARIYCVSPLVRTSEAANSSGSTLGDFRTQISTAVSTRTSFCTYKDGSTIITTAELADVVHPNNAGMNICATAYGSMLGV